MRGVETTWYTYRYDSAVEIEHDRSNGAWRCGVGFGMSFRCTNKYVTVGNRAAVALQPSHKFYSFAVRFFKVQNRKGQS